MSRGFRWVAGSCLVAASFLGACGGGGGGSGSGAEIRLSVLSPVGVGLELEMSAYLACPREPGNSADSPCRDLGISRVDELTIDDAAAFTVAPASLVGRSDPAEKPFTATFVVKANAPASSTLRIKGVGDDGRRFEASAPIVARAIDRVVVTPTCGNQTASAPYLIATGSIFRVNYELYSGGERVWGSGSAPITIPGAQPWGAPTTSGMAVRMPMTPGALTITSPFDASFSLTVELYDPARQVQGLTLVRDAQLPEGPYAVSFPERGLRFHVFPSIAGRGVCEGDADVTLELENRTLCSFASLAADADGVRTTDPRGNDFMVYGLTEGTCRVTAKRSTATAPEASMAIDFYTEHPVGAGRWSWQAPVPQGAPLHDLFGFATNDVWAVGFAGVILHHDGMRWTAVDNGLPHTTKEDWPKPDLRSIWGPSPDRLFAVGGRGLALHWDGSSWTRRATPTQETLFGVWGSSASDVWAVGWGGTILHWDGSAWTASDSTTTSPLMTVWTRAPGEAFAAGYNGAFLRWNGDRWAAESGLGSENIFGLHGVAPDDLWAVGTGGAAFHRTASGWSSEPIASIEVMHAVWALASNDVWTVGPRLGIRHWNGSRWEDTMRTTSNGSSALWGSATADVWAAGNAGHLEHWDGGRWTEHNQEATLREDITSMWTSPGGTVWATFAEQVAGGSPGLAPAGSILRFENGSWTAVPTDTTASFRGVWGSADDDVWAVGSAGTIVRWNGQNWSRVESNTTKSLNGIWGSGAGNIWVAAGDATVVHWNGGRWTPEQLENSILTRNPDYLAVWGASAGDVWVVGTAAVYQPSLIWHHDGQAWRRQTPPRRDGETLNAVWGLGKSDVWAVGQTGEVLHYDGTSWKTVRTGLSRELVGVWPASPTDVWVAGRFDTLRWNGQRWSTIQPNSYVMQGLHAAGGKLWLHGWDGALLQYQP